MKVIFEIDNNQLKAAAGIAGLQHPDLLNAMMEFASNVNDEEIIVSKASLEEMAETDKNFNQIPILVSMVALGIKFLEDD